MVEAVKAIDKKVMETTADNARSMELGSRLGVKGSAVPVRIKETLGDTKADLQATRRSIAQQNDAINNGIYQ